jgi:very-short-patch-repair endonuclease
VAAIERPEYRDMTFGVISLLGDDQAYEIEQLLLKHLPPDEYQRRRIVCGNSAQFQGDERDVMFLSMVWSAEDSPLRFLDRKEFRQRFNVAASRARNQMWLVYSLDPTEDLKPGDLRRRLIEHVLDPNAVTRELKGSLERTQSPFERLVLGHLVRAGYHVTPQWAVGNYRIDFVVEGGCQRLALECDGDRYHPLDQLPQDMERQAILERLGWRFIRIRGSSFFRDPERTMQGVFKKLEELDIPPERAQQPRTSDEDSLVSDIRRRASELRSSWQETSIAENQMEDASPPQPDLEGRIGKFGDKGDQPKGNLKESADSRVATQAPLFPREEIMPILAETESAIDSWPRVPVSDESVADRVESRDGSSGDLKNSIGPKSMGRLLSILDETIFPAVAGTEPRGSRGARLDRWRRALGSSDATPEALFAALAEFDPAISKGKDGQKILAAIWGWHVESED